MTAPCTKCSRPAHFYFLDGGGLLCPDHAALHCMGIVKDLLERSRLSNSDPSDCRDSPDGPAATMPSAPEGAAGNSFEDGIPAFLTRGHPDCIVKNNSASRVAASSLIQESSSHI